MLQYLALAAQEKGSNCATIHHYPPLSPPSPILSIGRGARGEGRQNKNRSEIIRAVLAKLIRAGATGLEPAISGLTGRRVDHYTTPPNQ